MAADKEKRILYHYNWTRNRASKQSILHILQVQIFLLGLTTSHKNHEIHFKTGRWGCLYAGGGL